MSNLKFIPIFLLIMCSLNLLGQNNNYTKQWQEVDSLRSKRLPKDAIKIIHQIYEQAQKDNNPDQTVKATVYKMIFAEHKENANLENLQFLENEIIKSKFPVKPVLESLAADLYWQYYQNERWIIEKRTKVEGADKSDIATWTIEDFVDKVNLHYQNSLANIEKLQKTDLGIYSEVLAIPADKSLDKKYLESDKSRHLRPTLYDLLAHRAIDFWAHSEAGITQPIYKFEITRKDYFADNQKFTKFKIQTRDSVNFKFLAIRTLQDLIKFHQKDTDKTALVDVDLKRLDFVFSHSVHPEKNTLYLKGLESIQNKYKNVPLSADASYEIAKYYHNQASKYHPFSAPQYRDDYKIAMKICQEVIQKFPDSQGAKNCTNLVNVIQNKSLNLTMDTYSLPNRPLLSLVKFRNTKQVQCRIYPYEQKKFNNLDGYNESKNKFLKKLFSEKPIKSWKLDTPDDNADFQNHSFEMKVPALEKGKYILFMTEEDEFDPEKAYGYARFQVTNLSFIQRKNEQGDFEIYALDRSTGYPVKNAEVRLRKQKYNYNHHRYVYSTIDKQTTDENGYVRFTAPNKTQYNVSFEIEKGGDILESSNSHYLYQKKSHTKTNNRAHFFLDRGIYRPGQTIYFKAILTRQIGKKSEIIPNQEVNVVFFDANHQKVTEQKLTSNEFGTIHGTFTAPVGRLNGQMFIRISGYGAKYFRVEEYKRPKFAVEFLPLEGTFRLGDSVTVKGKAQAYSGANIDNAEVTYRIKRRSRFSGWWSYWYGAPSSPEVVITHGRAKTDENGEFTVTFEAVPDLGISKKTEPIFIYEISADVIDLNGETHSTSKGVAIGYKALEINTNIPEKLNLQKLPKDGFTINSTNLEGQFEATKGTWILHKLTAPEQTFRNRNWTRPDLFVMSKNEFYATFPIDPYDNENAYIDWKKSLVRQSAFDTKKSKIADLGNLKTGVYLLEIKAKDRYDETVQYFKYFTAFSEKSKTVPAPTFDFFQPIQTSAEPNEMAKFLVGTSAKGLQILYEIELDGKIIEKKMVKISQKQQLLEIPIKEEYRGGFGIHWTFFKENRYYLHSQRINVPYSNKKLKIEFETFRNKLLPGASEEWKLKVSGQNTDKIMAEMVATLYDASLDEFAPNSFDFNILSSNIFNKSWNVLDAFSLSSSYFTNLTHTSLNSTYRTYDRLHHFGFYMENSWGWGNDWNGELYLSAGAVADEEEVEVAYDEMGFGDDSGGGDSPAKDSSVKMEKRAKKSNAMARNESKQTQNTKSEVPNKPSKSDLSSVKTRTNFNETAFFYPVLQTDEKGSLVVKFTIPESLTRWKMLGLAHTKDLKSGTVQNELVTQKDLMVVPNAPRFFRENDEMVFTAKISNISKENLNGTAQIQFFNALTMQPIDKEVVTKSETPQKSFEVKAGQSTLVSWKITIPDNGIEAITYRVVAKAGNFSDGEEMALPVLKNRMLVTETLPLWVRGNQSKTFEFKKLMTNKSTTLRNQSLTLEITSNPAWYAVQALPYMMEYPYECAEQTFTRFYANSIASHVANQNPKIKTMFEQWKNTDSKSGAEALLSSLEKNQELKQLILEETPWVLNAKDESERKKRMGLLFDFNRMSDELSRALTKLRKVQKSNGGFPWFEGMDESRWVTQHIVSGMGHLDKLGIQGIKPKSTTGTGNKMGFDGDKTYTMIKSAVNYLDNEMYRTYRELKKLANKKKLKLKHLHTGSLEVQYLYARSFFKEIPVQKKHQEAFDYFLGQTNTYWTKFGNYQQGMIALVLNRFDKIETAESIAKSLKQRSLQSEEMGMYWKGMMNGGYWWHQAPIETQALMIEVFQEVVNDSKSVDEMRIWLLKQKQTQDWKTTKATAEACYALLLEGSDWLSNEELAIATVGTEKIDPKTREDIDVEAGTGYYKVVWSKEEVKPEMGKITVEKVGKGIAWGGVYWEYFEDLDKITTAETPLKLKKALFLKKDTDTGEVLEPITDKTTLKAGDLVKVRVELRVDRAMEYVHMKDMRASCFEPISTNSGYRWQDGLGYYESVKDASVNFFFGYLGQGTYVFEYPLRVTHEGDFSNGITTIQCMYAPEFSSHSEGVRVKVSGK